MDQQAAAESEDASLKQHLALGPVQGNPIRLRLTRNQSSTLTDDMSKDSHGSGAPLSASLDVLNGSPVTFNNAILRTIQHAQPEAVNGKIAQATATYTAGNVGGDGTRKLLWTVTANVMALQPPSIAKSFSPITVPVNAPSTITFSIINGNAVAIQASFTDSLPANLVVAATPNVVNNCGGTVTATASATQIDFSNAALAVGACTINVDVQSAIDNIYGNSVTIDSIDAGNGNTSSANLTVINPPTISKAFGAAAIPLNGTTSLSFTLTSNNVNLTLNGVAFADNLPAGLVVATPNNLNNTCAGTATAVAGSSSVSLSGGTLAPNSNCLVSVNVTGTAAGMQINTTSAVTSTEGGTGGTASASIDVVAPPTVTKGFTPGGIPPNGTSMMVITITNPAANTEPLSGVGVTDTFPANLVVATPGGLTNTCGGTATAADGSGSVSLTGGNIAINSSCTVSVNVTSSVVGSYVNSTDPVTSTNGGNGNSASATLSVALTPTISKIFVPDSVAVNGTTLLSFTINNPNSDPNTNVFLTGIAFTDLLPAGLVVASPNQLSNNCGGTVTADPGSSSISLSGGTLGPAVGLLRIPLTPLQPQPRMGKAIRPPQSKSIVRAIGPQQPDFIANGSCFISVEVQANTAGTENNTSGPISANESGPGATSNTATLTVTPAALVQPATVAKTFGDASIPVNGTTSLTFAFGNPNSTTAFVSISLNDTLPSGLVVASPNGLGGNCLADGAEVSANPGSNSISVTSLNLSGASSCSFSVNVTGTSSGIDNNTTGNVTASYDNGNGAFVGITGGTASASITVIAPPSIVKAFNPNLIGVNTTTSLAFTITNPPANPVALTGVAFTDVLPAGLTVANGSNAVCGGTLTTSGPNTISLSGAILPINGNCAFSVTVTATQIGSFTNTTGNVSSTNGGIGNTAAANLTVVPLVVTPTSIDFGDVDALHAVVRTVTITNTGNVAAPLTISITPGSGANANFFFFLSHCPNPLPAHQTCTVDVIFVAPQPLNSSGLGVSTATLNVISGSSTQQVSLRANVIDPEIRFNPAALSFGNHTVNSMTTKTVQVTNVGLTALNIQTVSIGGTNPLDFSANNLCPSSLAPGSSCQIQVTFSPKAKGSRLATLVVNSNDGEDDVPLSGTGK